MKKKCGICQYCREPGVMDAEIPGSGQWCSNSKSPRFRTRVMEAEGCDVFQARGKKAPLGMRLKVKAVGLGARLLRKK
ncbi:MAG: hypothetical protein ACOYZ6_08015 [Chloroflexota bacterium]